MPPNMIFWSLFLRILFSLKSTSSAGVSFWAIEMLPPVSNGRHYKGEVEEVKGIKKQDQTTLLFRFEKEAIYFSKLILLVHLPIP